MLQRHYHASYNPSETALIISIFTSREVTLVLLSIIVLCEPRADSGNHSMARLPTSSFAS